MSDLEALLRLLGGASATTLLLVGIWAMVTGRVRLPRELTACEEERSQLRKEVEEWRVRYYDQQGVLREATSTAEKAVR